MAAQSGFAEKRGTACQIGGTTRAIHEHRAQIALRSGVPGIGCDSIQPSRQNIVTRDGGVPCLKSAGELEQGL
jgi:hypothetical protein